MTTHNHGMDVTSGEPKNIAIIGGGFTGLTAAYTLAKKGHHVTVFTLNEFLIKVNILSIV